MKELNELIQKWEENKGEWFVRSIDVIIEEFIQDLKDLVNKEHRCNTFYQHECGLFVCIECNRTQKYLCNADDRLITKEEYFTIKRLKG